MKHAAAVAIVVGAWGVAGGCNQTPASRFEHGKIRLEVRGRLISDGWGVGSSGRAAGGENFCGPDAPVRQVMIDAKLVGIDRRRQAILGIDWILAGGERVRPIFAENTTPQRPPITVGFGFGVGGGGGGGGGHGGHGPGCSCEACRGGGRESRGGAPSQR